MSVADPEAVSPEADYQTLLQVCQENGLQNCEPSCRKLTEAQQTLSVADTPLRGSLGADAALSDIVANPEASPAPVASPAPLAATPEAPDSQQATAEHAGQVNRHASRATTGLQNRLERTRTDLTTVSDSHLQTSHSILDGWEQVLGQKGQTQYPNDPALFQHDQQLVAQATGASRGQGKFTEGDALSARLPALRGNLYLFARAQELTEKDDSQLGKLAGSLAQFQKLAQASDGHARGLASVAPSSVVTATPAAALALAAGPSAGPRSPSRLTQGLGPELAASLTPERGAASAATPSWTQKGASLRARLAEGLTEGTANAAEALMGQGFHGELGMPILSASAAAPADAFFEKIESVAFSMSGVKTDAAIQGLEREFTELGQGDRAGAWLPAESESLFRRVRRAHEGCLRRACLGKS